MVRNAPAPWNSWRLALVVVAMMSVADLAPQPSLADGAVALGRPADIGKSGVATGISFNFGDAEGARKRAIDECKSSKDASQPARDLCKLIVNFRDHCVAISLDPKAGTPGFGWSLGIDKDTAEQEAKAACIATAGKAREKSCVISLSRCDGTAK